MQDAHKWGHTNGVKRSDVSPGPFIKEAMEERDVTAVVVKDASGAPTALVLMNLDVHKSDIEAAREQQKPDFDVRWAGSVSYISLLSTRNEAKKGHASLAMLTAMKHAKDSGKRIVYLEAARTVVAYYLTNSFGLGVHAFLLESEELFESSRAFALSTSGRDFADIEKTIARAMVASDVPTVAFVLHGKDALAGLNYGDMTAGAPPDGERAWLGQHVAMHRVTVRTPLVVGHTYEVVLATGGYEGSAEELTGHLGALAGRRKLAGAFSDSSSESRTQRKEAALPLTSWQQGEYLRFANGKLGGFVAIRFDPNIGFRRTTQTHGLIRGHDAHDAHEAVMEVVTRSVAQLPDSASMNKTEVGIGFG